MIDVFCDRSPNAYKILILLEEIGAKYRLVPVDLSGDLTPIPGFLEASPDGKIPAIVDYDEKSERVSCSVFESGAILLYLAEQAGRYLPEDASSRVETLKWLFWQTSSFGPVLGQLMHFRARKDAGQEVLGYFRDQARRLYRFLDRELAHRDYATGLYSIADMAIYPWVVLHESQGMNLPDYPGLMRWYFAMEERAAVERAYDLDL